MAGTPRASGCAAGENPGTTIDGVMDTFESLVCDADSKLSDKITGLTDSGSVTSTVALQVQKLTSDLGVLVQTASSLMKAIKDDITTAARNI